MYMQAFASSFARVLSSLSLALMLSLVVACESGEQAPLQSATYGENGARPCLGNQNSSLFGNAEHLSVWEGRKYVWNGSTPFRMGGQNMSLFGRAEHFSVWEG